jgi:hypothetical protein
MVKVLASPRSVPELIDGLAARRLDGGHTHDDWHGGVLHLAAPLWPEEGELTAHLTAYLMPLASALGLAIATPATIGEPGDTCRVPAIVVFDRATPRTSPDALSTAELVIEIVGTDDRPVPDLAFYAAWRVREHLAVDLDCNEFVLRRADEDDWAVTDHSQVLGFDVVEGEIVSIRGRLGL